MREITYGQAIKEAHSEEMKRDDSIVMLGIELQHMGGGLGQTAGIFEEFGPERVYDTPISESGYVGLAVGMAMGGLRPIVEVQFADFLGYAFDSLVNQAAKARYLSDGKQSVPMVVKSPQGMGFFFGAQHSQCVESWFINAPGLKIVAPATPEDAKGLMKTAIRDDDPVLFLEHKACVFTKGPVPEEEYVVPLGQAKVVREGSDVTIVALQKMMLESLAAADELAKDGISVEVVDPRSIVPLDTDTIVSSVKKTGRLVVANEAPVRGGFTAEVCAVVAEKCVHDLRAPIERLGAANCPIPFGPPETHVLPGKDDIVKAVRAAVSSDAALV